MRDNVFKTLLFGSALSDAIPFDFGNTPEKGKADTLISFITQYVEKNV